MGVIVVATDGSASADGALDTALGLASDGDHRVAVITVWRALQGDFGLAYPPTAVLSDLLEAERRHAESTLAEAAERAQAAGVPVTTRLATGDPAERICAYARELDARLVVMGTHGYGAVMSLLLGSVSSTVVRRAGCPVVVVPMPSPAGAPAAAGTETRRSTPQDRRPGSRETSPAATREHTGREHR